MSVPYCPIAYVYGTPEGRDADGIVGALLALSAEAKRGRVLPLGGAPLIYEEGLALLAAAEQELEWLQWRETERKTGAAK